MASFTSSIALYITEYVFISISSFSAAIFASGSGLTLNAMIIACATFAKVTSDSVTPPTFACITFTFTSSLDNFSKLDCTASTEPCTSAFTIKFNSFSFPFSIWLNKSFNDNFEIEFIDFSLA